MQLYKLTTAAFIAISGSLLILLIGTAKAESVREKTESAHFVCFDDRGEVVGPGETRFKECKVVILRDAN